MGHREQLAVTPHVLGPFSDGFARQRFFDAVIVVSDFERAEVEFADVRGRERIFASALAAFQRLHVTVFVTHINSCWRLPGDAAKTRARKKPFLMTRKGYKKSLLPLIFPKLMMPGLELAPVIET